MSDENINRRDFLRSTAISGAVGLGGAAAASGSASAKTASQTARIDPGTAESLVDEHAGDLLSGLADEGVLTTADPAALPTDVDLDVYDAKSSTGTAFLTPSTRPDRVLVSLPGVHSADGVTARLQVQPETGESVVYYEDADDNYRAASIQDGNFVVEDIDTQASCSCGCDENFCYDCSPYYWDDKRDYICCYSGGLCDFDCGGCT